MEVEGAARALALVVVAGTEDFFFPPFHASRHTGSYYDGLRTGYNVFEPVYSSTVSVEPRIYSRGDCASHSHRSLFAIATIRMVMVSISIILSEPITDQSIDGPLQLLFQTISSLLSLERAATQGPEKNIVHAVTTTMQ